MSLKEAAAPSQICHVHSPHTPISTFYSLSFSPPVPSPQQFPDAPGMSIQGPPTLALLSPQPHVSMSPLPPLLGLDSLVQHYDCSFAKHFSLCLPLLQRTCLAPPSLQSAWPVSAPGQRLERKIAPPHSPGWLHRWDRKPQAGSQHRRRRIQLPFPEKLAYSFSEIIITDFFLFKPLTFHLLQVTLLVYGGNKKDPFIAN